MAGAYRHGAGGYLQQYTRAWSRAFASLCAAKLLPAGDLARHCYRGAWWTASADASDYYAGCLPAVRTCAGLADCNPVFRARSRRWRALAGLRTHSAAGVGAGQGGHRAGCGTAAVRPPGGVGAAHGLCSARSGAGGRARTAGDAPRRHGHSSCLCRTHPDCALLGWAAHLAHPAHAGAGAGALCRTAERLGCCCRNNYLYHRNVDRNAPADAHPGSWRAKYRCWTRSLVRAGAHPASAPGGAHHFVYKPRSRRISPGSGLSSGAVKSSHWIGGHLGQGLHGRYTNAGCLHP